MRFLRFNMVFGAAAPAVNAFVEPPGVAVGERGDVEARVRTLRASLDRRDDALGSAPVFWSNLWTD